MIHDMSADDRTWLNSAISKHLKDGISLEDARTHFIGSMLVQILLYYRYDIPNNWRKKYSHADSLSLGKGLTDVLAAARCCGLAAPLTREQQEIYEALEEDNWEHYHQLSSPIWKALSELSGLDKEDWENLPNAAEEALAKTIVCTCCGYTDDIYRFGEVMEYVDPFTFGGGTRIRVRCKRCFEKITFEPVVVQVKKRRRLSEDTRVLILAAGAIVLVLAAIGLLQRILIKV